MLKKYSLVAFLLFLHAGILLHSASRKSASVDEMSHLAAGLYSLSTLDFRVNRAAPPLQNLVCAVPVALFPGYQLSYDNESWNKGIWNGSGDRLLEANPGRMHELLMWGRLGTIGLSVCLCFVAFLWAYELWGWIPALCVLILTVFEPNIMAHGRLITTDTAPTLLFLLTGYLFWRFTKRPCYRTLILTGVGFGLSWYAKHSGVVLLPALGIGFAVFVWTKREWRLGWIPKLDRSHPAARVFVRSLVILSFVTCIGLLTLWAGYAFEVGDTIPGPVKPSNSQIWQELQVPIRTVIYALGLGDRLTMDSSDPDQPFWMFLRNYLPLFNHWEGFLANRAHLEAGHLGYFMGKRSSYGWRSYYPILFLIKTPVPLLLIFALGALLLCVKAVRLDALALTGLLVIPGVYLYVLIFYSTANIGYRHALPALPFFIILFGGAAAQFVTQLFERTETSADKSSPVHSRRTLAGIGLFLIAWMVWEAVMIHPHYLEYFNALIGGPKNGHEYAVDSNLDWGQDLLYAKEYIEKNQLQDAYLLYFGPQNYPDVYHVPHKKFGKQKVLAPGDYIVSASFLHGIGAGALYPVFEPLRRAAPDEYITYAVFVYRVVGE